MPRPRLRVHSDLLETSGYVGRVYYNPPENVKMQYPCIVYNLADYGAQHADNLPYYRYDSYTVTHIYQKEEQSSLSRKLAETSGFSFDRSYRADNLYHDVFTLRVY